MIFQMANMTEQFGREGRRILKFMYLPKNKNKTKILKNKREAAQSKESCMQKESKRQKKNKLRALQLCLWPQKPKLN
jgi:hypothetical protein